VERLFILGPGRLGLSLGLALEQSGEAVELHYLGRRPEPPEHPLFHQGQASYHYGVVPPPPGTTALILAVPDQALAPLSEELAALGDAPAGCAALHCSGALGADPLAPLHARGYSVGTLHPLLAVPSPLLGIDHFRGGYFAVSGEPEALVVARRLVALLGGRGITVPPSRRPLYHAAAVMASNHMVILLREAVRLLEEAGAPPEDAEAAMTRLALGSLTSVASLGVDAGLTGPLRRGDVETVELHLRALRPEDRELYLALARPGLEWLSPTLSSEAVDRFRELFERYG
jgi:hypothetical protein